MSFGTSAASYVEVLAPGGILQQNSGIWTGTAMSVSLPSATNATSTIALFVAGNTIVPTPAGWTLRESQVNWMGHYLFTVAGGVNSWNITTNSGLGTWYVAEVGAAYEVSASAHDTNGSHLYTTPTLTPTAGPRLLLASVASLTTGIASTITDWTDNFTEVADVCNPTSDYPMQGVAVRDVSADGMTGYMTTATYSQSVGTRSAIIASFIL